MRGVVSRHEPEAEKENHAAHNLGAFATPLQATGNNSMKTHPNRKRVLRRINMVAVRAIFGIDGRIQPPSRLVSDTRACLKCLVDKIR